MDTRFSVDVNVDADADGNAIIYLNGGITSTVAAPPGQTDQRAHWDSRIRRPITITNEAHHLDFDVTVPTGNVGQASTRCAVQRQQPAIHHKALLGPRFHL